MAAASADGLRGGASVATPRLRSIDDLEALLARAPRDEHAALRVLAPEWQLQLVDGDPCALAAGHDVHCFRAHGGLALLRLLARPGVLALRDAQDRPVYVVLTGLGHDDATLLVGTTPLQVPLALLTTAWRGDFTTFWRVPGGLFGAAGHRLAGPAGRRAGRAACRRAGGVGAGAGPCLRRRRCAPAWPPSSRRKDSRPTASPARPR